MSDFAKIAEELALLSFSARQFKEIKSAAEFFTKSAQPGDPATPEVAQPQLMPPAEIPQPPVPQPPAPQPAAPQITPHAGIAPQPAPAAPAPAAPAGGAAARWYEQNVQPRYNQILDFMRQHPHLPNLGLAALIGAGTGRGIVVGGLSSFAAPRERRSILGSAGEAAASWYEQNVQPRYNQILDFMRQHPQLRNLGLAALIGAGVGGGISGLSSFGAPRERRNTLGSAVSGALGGGALLGGGYLAARYMQDPEDPLGIADYISAPDLSSTMSDGRPLTPRQELQKEIADYQRGQERSIGDYLGHVRDVYTSPVSGGVLGAAALTDAARYGLGYAGSMAGSPDLSNNRLLKFFAHAKANPSLLGDNGEELLKAIQTTGNGRLFDLPDNASSIDKLRVAMSPTGAGEYYRPPVRIPLSDGKTYATFNPENIGMDATLGPSNFRPGRLSDVAALTRRAGEALVGQRNYRANPDVDFLAARARNARRAGPSTVNPLADVDTPFTTRQLVDNNLAVQEQRLRKFLSPQAASEIPIREIDYSGPTPVTPRTLLQQTGNSTREVDPRLQVSPYPRYHGLPLPDLASQHATEMLDFSANNLTDAERLTARQQAQALGRPASGSQPDMSVRSHLGRWLVDKADRLDNRLLASRGVQNLHYPVGTSAEDIRGISPSTMRRAVETTDLLDSDWRRNAVEYAKRTTAANAARDARIQRITDRFAPVRKGLNNVGRFMTGVDDFVANRPRMLSMLSRPQAFGLSRGLLYGGLPLALGAYSYSNAAASSRDNLQKLLQNYASSGKSLSFVPKEVLDELKIKA